MRNSTRLWPSALALSAMLAACGPGAPNAAEQAEREKQFAESMTQVVLDGHFTVNRGDRSQLRKERYAIEKASKVAGDLWTIQARIQYGDHDVALPVPVKIIWAEDTPIISLTDLTLPGLGTFTARILIYRDHYAGFWQHGESGGNQFGLVLRKGDPGFEPEAEPEPTSEEPAETPAP